MEDPVTGEVSMLVKGAADVFMKQSDFMPEPASLLGHGWVQKIYQTYCYMNESSLILWNSMLAHITYIAWHWYRITNMKLLPWPEAGHHALKPFVPDSTKPTWLKCIFGNFVV